MEKRLRSRGFSDFIPFYDKITCPRNQGKVVDIGFLDLHMAFGTVPPSILLSRFIVCLLKKRMKVRTGGKSVT